MKERNATMERILTLRQARKASEVSQKSMAAALGISKNTYLKIERQPDLATIAQAKKISKILNISYAELFFGTVST